MGVVQDQCASYVDPPPRSGGSALWADMREAQLLQPASHPEQEIRNMVVTPSSATDAIITETSAAGGFFSSGLRGKVDQWMDILWSGGVNNPMDSIEQLSYLLFLRLLSDRDTENAAIQKTYRPAFQGDWSRFAWGNFVTLTGDELFDTLRNAIERLHELPGLSPTGKELFRNANLKIYDRPTLRAVVQGISAVELTSNEGYDLKGDMYEYLLSKLSQSGTNGQFRTPRHIIEMIVDLVDPQPDQRICDPACGTAGFLVGAYTHILREHTRPADLRIGLIDGSLLTNKQSEFLEKYAFHGSDNDANMVKLAIMNLYLHQLERADVVYWNPLTSARGGYPGLKYDVILANPPFSGEIQKESVLADIGLATRATETLFMKWFMDHLSEHGICGVIVPEGVVLGQDKASRRVREMLLQQYNLEAVVALPHFVFKPYASVATFVLLFRAGGSTSRVWMYNLSNDGYSPDGLRLKLGSSEIPELLELWTKCHSDDYVQDDSKHRFVSLQELERTGLSLAPRSYITGYRVVHTLDVKSIGELCDSGCLSLKKGKSSAQSTPPGIYPLVTTSEELKSSDHFDFSGHGIVIPLVSSTGHGHASIKRLGYVEGDFAAATITAVLQVVDTTLYLPKFIYYFLESQKDDLLVRLMSGLANVSLSLEKIRTTELPILPIADQEEMIQKLDAIMKEKEMLFERSTRLDAERDQLLSRLRGQFIASV